MPYGYLKNECCYFKVELSSGCLKSNHTSKLLQYTLHTLFTVVCAHRYLVPDNMILQ